MPPRCCAQALPSRVLRDALDGDAQRTLFAAVAHFGTPRRARVYCPDADCGAFIQQPGSADRKHPLDITCQRCQARACRTCRGTAHGVGADCPEDWELEAVKKIAGRSSATRWRRCHGCRSLVSLSAAAAAGQRGARMVCRCKEELCALCGGVWDATTGCPNLCGDEEAEPEPERRRGSRLPSHASSSSDNKHRQDETPATAADKRPQLRDPAVQDLAARQALELHRFCTFSARTRSALQSRHASDRLALVQRHMDSEDALSARHASATAALEDRQIAAEMELRAALEQAARSVNLRLKHMEAYCRPATSDSRVVTEGNLRELGQQYALRDGMERQHQAKVNVMRERQARRMAELLDAQEQEAEAAAARQRGEAKEGEERRGEGRRKAEDELRARQVRLDARWRLEAEVLRRERAAADGVEYAEVVTPEWPREQLLDGEQETM
ncbi:IBR finger domain protein [Cordyceps fumosorosea ARSEF 2679]|uniref:IBR finger domain protein n=1 Tax=Cordyceps fumosorosea (strain ARSEF 2679) TaxID=1081104 RepID=A0A167NL88_CORFA|nr:IBR finger domain protein [Cordyceps fumosorosea ARSEF 2679]OAA55679.1 IBR finger domain protein [Cordyceps fumosorosea ARSEF 2679]